MLQVENTLCVSQWGRRVGEFHRAYIGQCYTPATSLLGQQLLFLSLCCNALLGTEFVGVSLANEGAGGQGPFKRFKKKLWDFSSLLVKTHISLSIVILT